MGRAERRKKYTLTEEELETIVGTEVARYSQFHTDAFICALSIALHEEYGFGHDRILRALKRIYWLLEPIGDVPNLLDEYKYEVERDLKLDFEKREWESDKGE